jgi:hypothetical protein
VSLEKGRLISWCWSRIYWTMSLSLVVVAIVAAGGLPLPTGAKCWLRDVWGRDGSMDDQSARESREDRPDPTAEPDSGAVPGGSGSGLAASDNAQNGETVLDPDRESEDPAAEIGDEIDRLEGHSRQPTSSAHPESPPPDTPPG